MWLAVLCIPAMLINMGGDGLEEQKDPTVQFVEASTLGNFGLIYEWERGGLGDNETHTAPSIGLAPPAPASYGNDTAWPWTHGASRNHNFFSQPKDELMVGMSYFNMVFLAMFAACAFLIPGIQRKIIKEVDANMCTIEDYSVVITDLPEDVKDQEIHKFFDKKVGKVENVVVATNNAELLTLAFERQKAKELFHMQVAKYKKGREDPDVSDRKIEWLHDEAVKAKNPGIVYCSISAFGQDGAYPGRAAHDLALEVGDLSGEHRGVGLGLVDVRLELHDLRLPLGDRLRRLDRKSVV